MRRFIVPGPHGHALGSEEVHLRVLPEDLYQAEHSQQSPETSHGREALHLPRPRLRDDLRPEDGLQDSRQEEAQHRDHDLRPEPGGPPVPGQPGPDECLSEDGTTADTGEAEAGPAATTATTTT